jgi:hypothetical protein
MDMKKRMRAIAVLAVVMFGTAAGAAPVAFRLSGGKVGRTTLKAWSKDGTTRTYELIVQR